MTGSRPVVAAFDFDHTLTTRDSVVPFLAAVAGWPRLAVGVGRRPIRTTRALVARDRDGLRTVATEAVFAGRQLADIDAAAGRFAATLIASGLRDDAVDCLRGHVARGDRVVIVSASYENYLRPVAAELGVAAVLSTRLEHVDGRCTGMLLGPNCRGEEKVRRLAEWFVTTGLDRDEVELHAYGDSAGDRALLAWADRPVWVGSAPFPALA